MPARDSTLYFAIDAGNTRIKYGLFDPAGVPLPRCVASGHVLCGESIGAAFVESLATDVPIRAVLSGSNPPEIARLADAWPQAWPPLTVLTDRTRLPIRIDVDFPDKVGLDRLLNAVASLRLRAAGQPVIVVDSGTATTVDYVGPEGSFRGGAILPGIGMSARALHQYTALLPLIPAPDVTSTPPEAIGRNTVAAMRSGLFWGHIGGVRELVSQMASGSDAEPRILITGGAGYALVPFLKHPQAEPFLPLQGLVLAFSGI